MVPNQQIIVLHISGVMLKEAVAVSPQIGLHGWPSYQIAQLLKCSISYSAEFQNQLQTFSNYWKKYRHNFLKKKQKQTTNNHMHWHSFALRMVCFVAEISFSQLHCIFDILLYLKQNLLWSSIWCVHACPRRTGTPNHLYIARPMWKFSEASTIPAQIFRSGFNNLWNWKDQKESADFSDMREEEHAKIADEDEKVDASIERRWQWLQRRSSSTIHHQDVSCSSSFHFWSPQKGSKVRYNPGLRVLNLELSA